MKLPQHFATWVLAGTSVFGQEPAEAVGDGQVQPDPAATSEPEAEPERDLTEEDWKVFWRNGLRVENETGDFWIRIGGRLNMDWGTVGSTELLDPSGNTAEDGTFFRRARLELDGQLYGTVRYRMHIEFAGADVAFRDLWGEWTEIPIRFGRFREPMGLEANTSSNALTFLERSIASIVLTPGRNSGVMYKRLFADDQAAFYLGGFRQTDSQARSIGDDVALTGRVTWLPYENKAEEQLLHVGLAATQRSTRDGGVPIGVRLEAFFVDRVVDAVLPADEVQEAGAEIAWVDGPWSAQAEILGLDTDGSGSDDATLWGTYAQVSWCPTGETRPYKRSRSAFDIIDPKRDFSLKEGGGGAWELAARWSRSDLTDVPEEGDIFENFTLGANWYANPTLRVMFNWIHSTRDRVADDDDLFLLRFQVRF